MARLTKEKIKKIALNKFKSIYKEEYLLPTNIASSSNWIKSRVKSMCNMNLYKESLINEAIVFRTLACQDKSMSVIEIDEKCRKYLKEINR